MAAPTDHEKNANKVIKSVSRQSNEKRLIVVLEKASLESVKVCISCFITFYLSECTFTSKVNGKLIRIISN